MRSILSMLFFSVFALLPTAVLAADAAPAPAPVRPPEEIIRAFSVLSDEVFKAYTDRRKRKPGLYGKAVYDVTVEGSGAVDIKLGESTLKDPPLEKTLLDILKKVKFEPVSPPEKTSFQFPIDFPREGWDKSKKK